MLEIFRCSEGEIKERESKLKNEGGNFIKTGTEWDNLCKGLYRGGLSIIGSFSGRGKTSWLIDTSRSIAKQGYKVLFITVEESIDSIFKCWSSFYEGKVIVVTITQMKDWEEIEKLIKEEKIDVVLYDYIGAIREGLGGVMREDQILSEDARKLANLALKMKVAVLAGIQTKEDAERDYVQNQAKKNNLFRLSSNYICSASYDYQSCCQFVFMLLIGEQLKLVRSKARYVDPKKMVGVVELKKNAGQMRYND